MKFDLVAWGAELTPERPALWFNGRWYTYRDLNERATRLANQLAAAGIVYGGKVGILAPNHLAHFDLLFAAAKLGFIFIPFDPRLSVPELRELAHAVRPDLLFCDTPHANAAAQAFACTRVTLDEYRRWLANSSRQDVPVPLLSPESIQMILFTGGSTGRAKAAMIPYRQMLANAQGTAMGWNLGPEDCAIQATPCWHAALNVLSTPLLTIGGRVAIMSRFEPGEYLRLAEHLEATTLFMVPSMYRSLVEHPAFARTNLTRVRFAISGGAPCPAPVARAFLDRGLPFRQGYGMTEAGVNCFGIETEEAALYPQSVGRPLPHVQVEIRRPDGQPCADEETGELTISGQALCAGYYNRSEEWMDACRDGWFWTGDLAQRDAEGRYFIRGRRKDLYISGGENVYPVEVEAAIAECEGVAECAVLSIPDARWGETGLAAVVMRDGRTGQAEALRSALRARLAAYKLPSVIRFVPSLPRTGAGKIDRPALRSLLEASTH
jgi:fatty-acyl-CoA synthase